MLKTYILSMLSMVCCIVNATPDKLALLVGISDYHAIDTNNEWNDIHGENDVVLLEPILKSQDFNVVSLTNINATKQQILNELLNIENKASKGSIVYIHFSMHGQPFQDLDGDEEDGWDESLVPVDANLEYIEGKYEGQNHITDDELISYTNRIRSKIGETGCLYVTVDACHAGGSYRGGSFLENDVRGTTRGFSMKSNIPYKAKIENKSLYNIKEIPNFSPVVFLEACQNTQINTEIKKKDTYYGKLSYYVSSVLENRTIGTDISWVYEVKREMDNDQYSFRRQNMVIETTIKR